MGRILNNKNNNGFLYYSFSIYKKHLEIKSVINLLQDSKIIFMQIDNSTVFHFIVKKYGRPIEGNVYLAMRSMLPYMYIDRVFDENYYRLWSKLKHKKILLQDETIVYHKPLNVFACEMKNEFVSMNETTGLMLINGLDEPLGFFDFTETDLRKKCFEAYTYMRILLKDIVKK